MATEREIEIEKEVAFLGPDKSTEGQRDFAEELVKAHKNHRADYYEAQEFVRSMPAGYFNQMYYRRIVATLVIVVLIICVIYYVAEWPIPTICLHYTIWLALAGMVYIGIDFINA